MSYNKYNGNKDIDFRLEVDRLNQKKKLREYYKQIKAGIILLDDVPVEYRALLQKYYGCY